MTTGDRIKFFRKEKGLTQREVAERCGMADSAIRKYESGHAHPKVETVVRIAKALDVPVSGLLSLNRELTAPDVAPGIAPTAIRPDYYRKGGMECFQAVDAATCNLQGPDAFDTGNAIKYLWRWKDKNGTEDLKKAITYIQRIIARETQED